MFFLCPFCKKAPHSLPGHLRKVCMQNRTEAEIQAVVIEAKKELSEFCHKGRFWEFEKIRDILDSTNPLARLVTHSYAYLIWCIWLQIKQLHIDIEILVFFFFYCIVVCIDCCILCYISPYFRMVEEMQSRGLVINNLPPVLPEPARPSTSVVPQSCGGGAEGPVEPPSDSLSDESSGEYYQRYRLTSAFPETRCKLWIWFLLNLHSRFYLLLFFFFTSARGETGGPLPPWGRRWKKKAYTLSTLLTTPFYVDFITTCM